MRNRYPPTSREPAPPKELLMKRIACLAVAVLIAACGDTRPTSPSDTGLNAAISDGSRTGGNPDFFFLPSLAPDPRRLPNFDAGGFNPSLAPVVKVCLHPRTAPDDLRAFDCNDAPIATISGSDVRVFPALQFYLAVWKTRDYDLDPDRVYRVQVFLGSTRLGFADVTVVKTLREARNAITGDIVPLGEDWTLPIPFRIENGALGACKSGNPDCTEVSVKQEGGTFLTKAKFAAVQLQPGWATKEAFDAGGGAIQLTIERLQELDGNCHEIEDVSRRLFDELTGCYEYKLDPDIREFGGFQGTGNKVGQCSGKARTEANKGEDYQLFKSDGTKIVPLEDTAEPEGLNCAEFAFIEGLPSHSALRFASMKWHSVKGVLRQLVGVNIAYAWDGGLGGILPPFDGFSHISRGRGLNITAVEGDDQSAVIGDRVPTDPRVRITSTHVHLEDGAEVPHEHGVAGVPVTFTVQGGNFGTDEGTEQSITELAVETNANGEVSVPWYVTAASSSVVVTASTIDPTPITFTATGIAPADLVISSGTPTVTPNAITLGSQVTLSAGTVKNLGDAAVRAGTNVNIEYRLSTDATITTSDLFLGSSVITSSGMTPGQEITGPATVWAIPGNLTPPNLAPGDYWIGILADPGNEVAESNESNNFVSTPLRVASPTGSASGTVTDATTEGVPIPGALITVVGTSLGAVTSEDGRYLIQHVPAGPQTIRAARFGYATVQSEGVVVVGGQTATADFHLVPRTGTIAGTVRDDAGAPVAGLTLHILLCTGISSLGPNGTCEHASDPGFTVSTGDDGTYQRAGLLVGIYNVIFNPVVADGPDFVGSQPANHVVEIASDGQMVNASFVALTQDLDFAITRIDLSSTCAVDLASCPPSWQRHGELTINGPVVPYTYTVYNATGTSAADFVIQTFVEQGDARRTAGGEAVSCGAGTGVLPPGMCQDDFTIGASNTGAGSGVLTTGPATARFELKRNGAIVQVFTVGITLAEPVVIDVGIENVSLEGNILTIGGPAVPYTYSASNNTGITLGTAPGSPSPLDAVQIQAWVEQGRVTHGATGTKVRCGAGTGVLPPGTCNDTWSILASYADGAPGLFVPGSAFARFELYLNSTLLDAFTVPIILAAPPPTP